MPFSHRQLEATQKNLAGVCTQLLSVTGCPDADELRQEIDDWSMNIETRFDVISAVRTSPFQYLTQPLTEEEFKVVSTLEVPLLSSILLHIGTEALKLGIDQQGKCKDAAEKFFFTSSCEHKVDQWHMTCGMILHAARDTVMAPVICSTFQQQMLGLWYERLSKQKAADKIALMVGWCPVVRSFVHLLLNCSNFVFYIAIAIASEAVSSHKSESIQFRATIGAQVSSAEDGVDGHAKGLCSRNK